MLATKCVPYRNRGRIQLVSFCLITAIMERLFLECKRMEPKILMLQEQEQNAPKRLLNYSMEEKIEQA